ncbi:ABC transporter permease [Longimicrobium sp.]|uniref:ABC transporter permease n=1 Tax=Longimicrobium sp. TaxID=2029185 RepID=UPI003B3A2C61
MPSPDTPEHSPQTHVAALASVRVGVGALRMNPLRTVLATLGVIVGVGSLVAVLSLGDGMESYARRELATTTGAQNVYVTPVTYDTMDGMRIARDDFPRFGAADAARAAGVAGVGSASITFSGTTLVRGDSAGRDRAARVTAALANTMEFYGGELGTGRFFTDAEVAANAPVAVVSHNLARELAPGNDAKALVGRTVLFRGAPRTVVGVMKARENEEGFAAYVPLPAGAAVMAPGEADRARMLVLRAATVEQVDSARAATERWLAARYGSADRFDVATDKARSREMARGFLIFKVFMGAIAGISLLVGGIGIMNVLLASVTERTREIGIRKAVGARRRDIVLQFLAESVAITGSGSLLGLLFGLLVAFAVTAVMRATLDVPMYAGISLSTLAVAAFSAIIVGLTFGTYPALRAARLSPIDAIRHE